ncbi:cyclic AMP-dependent transcription factor ATF-6 beta-like [Varroa jacobsoni]|uniref:cyclic AMP-dependent transcription factor ATF-6 beta-like n=1 Tax=Varroa jacobsoni TaxID=62625 RepID=UPI000BF8681A|nr:cyclic AMP-dependent transcription factor ATF-6 beta-like [Varroa jacobsoni]
MEHFSGQDDFLENNLLSPEDLRFDVVDDGEPRSRCAAILGIRCDRRCASCESQDERLDDLELRDANDISINENDGKWNPLTEEDRDLVFSTINNNLSLADQLITGPKIHHSESIVMSDRAKISNLLCRSNATSLNRKYTSLSELKVPRRLLIRQQAVVNKGTYTRFGVSTNDNSNLVEQHKTDSSEDALRIKKKDIIQVSTPVVANNKFGSDMLTNGDHHDGSCSPDQLTSSSSDSGLSGGEWAEGGENTELSSIATSYCHKAGQRPYLRVGSSSTQSLEYVRTSVDSVSDGSHDDDIMRDLLQSCPQHDINGSSMASHLSSTTTGSFQQQPQQQNASQQQPAIHFSHQIVQVPLVQQQNVLRTGQHQQQVTCQLPATLLQAADTAQVGLVTTNPTMFIPVGPQSTMIPVMTATTAMPFASLQQQNKEMRPANIKQATRAPTPPQQRSLLRMPPGTISMEDALARKRQRMIRNRESALQSRQRRKEQTQLLQDEVVSLRSENIHLKDENANLKLKIAELEGRLRAATSKGAVLCVLGLVVIFNLGLGSPRETSQSLVLKGHITDPLDERISPVQTAVAAAVGETRHPISVNSRHLLWMNETRGIEELPFADGLAKGKPGCGSQWVNSTESLRVQEYLSRWASRAWALASGIPQGTQFTDGLQSPPFLRSSTSFWPSLLSGLDADPIRTIEEGPRASSDGSSVASKELPLPPSWPSRALLNEVRKRNDTFYLLAFSGPPDTVLLSARQANSTARPKIALLMPAIASAKNDTMKIPPGRVAVMQIDCEVVNTKTLYMRRSLLPKNVQVAAGGTQHKHNLRQQSKTSFTTAAKKQRRKP